jgi:AcrR family transcriptional regulator
MDKGTVQYMSENGQSKTREKIVEAAVDLFYRQGYQATVVNQIVDQAGVSKPTFYTHFPSKEDLCITYLKTRRTHALQAHEEAIALANTPYDRFMAPIHVLRDYMVNTAYRGCSHYNMLIEITDPDSPVVKEVRSFNDAFRELLRKVTLELLESDEKYRHLNPGQVADAYYLIFCGAIMFSQEYRATWPLDLALSQVSALVV